MVDKVGGVRGRQCGRTGEKERGAARRVGHRQHRNQTYLYAAAVRRVPIPPGAACRGQAIEGAEWMRMADLGGDLLEVVIRRCTDSRCMHYAKRRGSPAGSVVKRRMTRTGLRRRPLTLHVDGTAPGERRKTSRCDGGRYPRPAIGQTRGSCGTCSAHAVFIGKGGHSGGRAPELFSSSAVSTGGSRYARRLRLGERGKDGKTPVGAGDVAGLRRSRQMLICAARGATGRVTMRTPRDTRGMRVGRNMPAADDGVSV